MKDKVLKEILMEDNVTLRVIKKTEENQYRSPQIDNINGQYRIDIIEKKPSEILYEFYMYYYYIMNNINSDIPRSKELHMAQEYSLNMLMPKEDFLEVIDKFKNNNEIDMDKVARYFNVDSDLAILWGKIIGILGFWS